MIDKQFHCTIVNRDVTIADCATCSRLFAINFTNNTVRCREREVTTMGIHLISVIQNPEAMGVTRESIKALRNTLAERIRRKIAVVEIPTADKGCGFLILDSNAHEAIFTGDGFSRTHGGEGMAGYRTAKVLFQTYKITPTTWDVVDFDPYIHLLCGEFDKEAAQWLFALAQKIANTIPKSDYHAAIDSYPEYVRHLVNS